MNSFIEYFPIFQTRQEERKTLLTTDQKKPNDKNAQNAKFVNLQKNKRKEHRKPKKCMLDLIYGIGTNVRNTPEKVILSKEEYTNVFDAKPTPRAENWSGHSIRVFPFYFLRTSAQSSILTFVNFLCIFFFIVFFLFSVSTSVEWSYSIPD